MANQTTIDNLKDEQNKQTSNKSSPPDDFRRNYWRVSVDQGQTHHKFKIHAQKVGKIPAPILSVEPFNL